MAPSAPTFAEIFAEYSRGAFLSASLGARRYLAREPAEGRGIHLLTLAGYQLGHLDDAERWLGRAVLLLAGGDLVDAFVNWGSVNLAQGRRRDARIRIAAALAHDPGKARAFSTLSAILREDLQPTGAATASRRSAALEPGFAEAWTCLGNALQAAGELDPAIAAYARAIAIAPDNIVARGNKQFTLCFSAATDDERLFREARAWGERIESVWPPTPAIRRRPVGRRLRIGYHSFEFFFRSALDDVFPPLLRHHDRERFEIRLFADGGREDQRTAELRVLADGWTDLTGLDIAAKVELMRAADLDIAVCLTGYLPIQRLVFAPRVAPIQVAQMNHVATTGLRAFDFRITDPWLDPPGTDRWSVERLVRLTHGYVPVDPPLDAPEVSPLPALSNGFVTFGSFNNLTKVTPEALALWARVLTAVPNSQLLFKARAFTDPSVRSSYAERFGALGVEPERIEFVGDVAGHREHLAALGRADIALDPIPFAGGRTTIETLWMGVPVVNRRIQSLVGRLGSTMLVRAGLDGHVADTSEAFVAIAVGLAAEFGSLSEMRHGMRRRLRASMLCDAIGYTRELEDVFIAMAAGTI